jgi:molybdate transport system regulatory protein
VPSPVVRFRVDFTPPCRIGPGKIALLQEIARTGSLSQAARDLGMSYRRAWLLLSSLNTSFRAPVARTARGGSHGGGARLTDFGQALIRTYRAFDEDTQVRAARAFRSIAGLARRRASGSAVGTVRLSGR